MARRSTTAPNGGARTATSSFITSSRTAARSISSPASPSRNFESSHGRRKVTSANCARRLRASTARSSKCWPRALTCTNGRSSIANSLERWAEGKVTLLGDACHPMTPYMAQGAAMAIEDAAVLSRCLDGVEREGIANAFRRFEATRKERTSRVQQTSRTNTWLRERPMRTGSMAMTPGPCRWRREAHVYLALTYLSIKDARRRCSLRRARVAPRAAGSGPPDRPRCCR